MLQNPQYTQDLKKKIHKLYEDPNLFSQFLNANNDKDFSSQEDSTSPQFAYKLHLLSHSLKNLRQYTQIFESVDMDSDEDDIYEVLENEMAHIENEEEIKRYLTLNPTIWMKEDANRDDACEILKNKQVGQFIVRKSSQDNTFALSIRVPDNLSKPVNHYLLLKSDLGFEAQGSNLYFPTLASLLAHFCSYQSGGMPCLLRPPRQKKTDKISHFQAYSPYPGSGEEGESEKSFNSRASGSHREERGVAPVLRQTHSVPVQVNKTSKTSKNLPPPPPSETLIPKMASKTPLPSLPSISPSFRNHAHQHHPIQDISQNGLKQRPYMEPCHRLSRTQELDEVPIDYATIEYDTPPDSITRHHAPELPPRTYLNQTEVYSDPILSPDMNEYDEPGELLRNSIPIQRVRTTEESHFNHAHRFLPPPIPPKTASMLFESQRQVATTPDIKDEDSPITSQEANSGILHNSIRPKEVQSACKPLSPAQSDRCSDVYLDMDPRESSSEVEKDIELQVHHTLKHQKGSSHEESSPAYVNVLFNTIATMKGIKQMEKPFDVGFKTTQVRVPPPKLPTSVQNSNGRGYNPISKEHHYNRFSPINVQPHAPPMPPTAPLSPLQSKIDSFQSRRDAFGEKMISRPSLNELFNRPLPSPRNSMDRNSMLMIRRSNSADLLETPTRKTDKPPLLPKPKLITGNTSTHHRRSSSSHDCYNVDRTGRSDLSFKESLSRKRSAPSPTDIAHPKPILRGYQHSPEQFNGRERDTRKVNFSGSTEVRELTRQMDQRINTIEQRLCRSRSPVNPNKPTHPPPPPPPPPPARRHSVNFSGNNPQHVSELTNTQTEIRTTQGNRSANNLTSSNKGMTYPSTYMQPSLNGQNSLRPRQVQTLNRGSFYANDEGRRDRMLIAVASGDKFIRGLKDTHLKREPWKQDYDNTTAVTQDRSLELHLKPQSETTDNNTDENTNIQMLKDDFDTEKSKLKKNKYKKLRTPTQRVVMYICRLNGRAHPMGSKIHSFNKAILKRQQGDGHVNIEKTLEQVRRFIDGVKKHLLTDKVDVMTRKYRGQLVETTAGDSITISEDDLSERLDAICENSLYNIILGPLYEHLIKQIRYYLIKNEDLQKISVNIDKAINKSPVYLGIRENLVPPDEDARREVTENFRKLTEVYSPLRKLELLLDAVKLVYKSIRDRNHPNKTNLSLGADDFLPIFIYTLIHTGMKEIEVDFLYTWNLIDQNLLSGEGGYYLTTLCTAIEVLKQADFNSKDQNIEIL